MMAGKSLWIFLVLIFTNRNVQAEFCPDSDTAGQCFDDKIIPLVWGTVGTGIVFGISLVLLGLCLFYKSRNKTQEEANKAWVHEREPSNWLEDCQDLGIENGVRKRESRKTDLESDKAQHLASDKSVYSERETTIPISSNCSDIMDAIDSIAADTDYPKSSSEYYWAPEREKKNNAPSYYEDMKKYIHKAEVPIKENPGTKKMDDISSGEDSVHEI